VSLKDFIVFLALGRVALSGHTDIETTHSANSKGQIRLASDFDEASGFLDVNSRRAFG
jgi:hypothetical protein